MRHLITAAVCGVGLFGAVPIANVQVYPWCLTADIGAGAMVDRCYFRTYEQCAQERFVYGTTSFCIVNPEHYFAAPESARRPGKRKRAMVQ